MIGYAMICQVCENVLKRLLGLEWDVSEEEATSWGELSQVPSGPKSFDRNAALHVVTRRWSWLKYIEVYYSTLISIDHNLSS